MLRFKLILFIGLTLFAVIGVPAIMFPAGRITAWEIRYYIMLFLLIQIVGIFGILRLYNSVYVNTQMLARSVKGMEKLGNIISSIVKGMSMWKSALESNRAGVKTLTDALKPFKDGVDKMTESIRNLITILRR